MLYCKQCAEISCHNIEALSQRAEVTENLCFYQNQLEALQTDLFFDFFVQKTQLLLESEGLYVWEYYKTLGDRVDLFLSCSA